MQFEAGLRLTNQIIHHHYDTERLGEDPKQRGGAITSRFRRIPSGRATPVADRQSAIRWVAEKCSIQTAHGSTARAYAHSSCCSSARGYTRLDCTETKHAFTLHLSGDPVGGGSERRGGRPTPRQKTASSLSRKEREGSIVVGAGNGNWRGATARRARGSACRCTCYMSLRSTSTDR